jgi:hypothetical protein
MQGVVSFICHGIYRSIASKHVWYQIYLELIQEANHLCVNSAQQQMYVEELQLFKELAPTYRTYRIAKQHFLPNYRTEIYLISINWTAYENTAHKSIKDMNQVQICTHFSWEIRNFDTEKFTETLMNILILIEVQRKEINYM